MGANFDKIIYADVPVENGRAKVLGTQHIDGVPGTGAPIHLDWRDTAGGRTGRLLPGGWKHEDWAGPVGSRATGKEPAWTDISTARTTATLNLRRERHFANVSAGPDACLRPIASPPPTTRLVLAAAKTSQVN